MFDIIVLDLNMPITNGYEACCSILKLFKDQNLFGSSDNQMNWNLKPVIIAVSSYVNDFVIKNTREIGFDGAFMSPLMVDTIDQ
jgi:CheY-like chemotaxis protein